MLRASRRPYRQRARSHGVKRGIWKMSEPAVATPHPVEHAASKPLSRASRIAPQLELQQVQSGSFGFANQIDDMSFHILPPPR
jgi:hypothetical protein